MTDSSPKGDPEGVSKEVSTRRSIEHSSPPRSHQRSQQPSGTGMDATPSTPVKAVAVSSPYSSSPGRGGSVRNEGHTSLTATSASSLTSSSASSSSSSSSTSQHQIKSTVTSSTLNQIGTGTSTMKVDALSSCHSTIIIPPYWKDTGTPLMRLCEETCPPLPFTSSSDSNDDDLTASVRRSKSFRSALLQGELLSFAVVVQPSPSAIPVHFHPALSDSSILSAWYARWRYEASRAVTLTSDFTLETKGDEKQPSQSVLSDQLWEAQAFPVETPDGIVTTRLNHPTDRQDILVYLVKVPLTINPAFLDTKLKLTITLNWRGPSTLTVDLSLPPIDTWPSVGLDDTATRSKAFDLRSVQHANSTQSSSTEQPVKTSLKTRPVQTSSRRAHFAPSVGAIACQSSTDGGTSAGITSLKSEVQNEIMAQLIAAQVPGRAPSLVSWSAIAAGGVRDTEALQRRCAFVRSQIWFCFDYRYIPGTSYRCDVSS
eukprot:GHVN01077762.1.p1 GENE.GHVN01077762.1~~GHVN01077762.1.p1  ORF type:complete len:485 (+),score=120.12 GHVN01077762.1:61-1515(+)